MTLRTRISAAVVVLTVILLPAAAAAVGEAAPAFADDAPLAVSWGVRPTSVTGDNSRSAFAYSVTPGVEIEDYIGISNKGTTTTTFQTYATDATNDPVLGGFALEPSGVTPVDLGSWIKFRSATISIEPGKEARIPITILVPSDAHPGDHTAGIVASVFRTDSAAKGRQIRVEERVAARVYLHVAGTEKASVVTSGLTSTFEPSINPFGGGTTRVNYSVRNTGNARVDVTQKLAVSGPFGIVFATVTGRRVINLLPGQAVQEQIDVPGIFPSFLVWSAVSLTTAAPTDTVAAETIRTDGGVVAAALIAPKYASVTSNAVTGAVPWALLVLASIVAAAVWLFTRYLAVSRDRIYLAIDAAAADARAMALAEREQSVAHGAVPSSAGNGSGS